MDDAPEQHQLGELNIAPLAYASPGTTKEPGGACSSLADTRLGRWERLPLMHGPQKCVGPALRFPCPQGGNRITQVACRQQRPGPPPGTSGLSRERAEAPLSLAA